MVWIQREKVTDFLRHLPKQKFESAVYYLDKYPVTNRDYGLFIKAGGYRDSKYWDDEGWEFVQDRQLKHPRLWQTDRYFMEKDQPVVGVSWYEAEAYARWTGKHLPTEEYWEKAARGDDGRLYPWGDEEPDENRCNFARNVGRTTPVGKYHKGRSSFGAYDMVGNVWEWCDSEWSDRKIIRGGSWDSDPQGLRGSNRGRGVAGSGSDVIGFRCARTS